MEQIDLVPASVYNNKCLKTHSFTKHELLEYHAEQNPTNQIESPKEEINKKLFAEAHSIVDKILFCPRIKLSNSQTLILDGVETGLLLSDIFQQLPRKNAVVPDI